VRTAWQALRARRLRRRLAGPKLLRAFAGAYPEAFFIEIGANDGKRWDPLRPLILTSRWTGLMVEPLPSAFDELRRNYSGLDRVAVEHAAIAGRDGRLPFWHVARPEGSAGEVPEWAHALGSLSRDTLIGHAHYIPDLERHVVSTEVPCLTFASLCAKHRVETIDLILIDTEGYDYEIVKQIDFDTYRPRLLIYEHCHLSPGDRAECRGQLEGLGYGTMEEYLDTYCLDQRPDDRLTRAWGRMRPALPGEPALP
jgi:FkbM family methyltransferase